MLGIFDNNLSKSNLIFFSSFRISSIDDEISFDLTKKMKEEALKNKNKAIDTEIKN